MHDPDVRGFGSDSHSGAHPEVLAAMAAANVRHQACEGVDPYTVWLEGAARTGFGPTARAFAVFNGTAANVIGLQSVLPRRVAVICASTAHINTDEGAAPRRSAESNSPPSTPPTGS